MNFKSIYLITKSDWSFQKITSDFRHEANALRWELFEKLLSKNDVKFRDDLRVKCILNFRH